MHDAVPSEPLPVPGHTGHMPLPRWSRDEDFALLEPAVPSLYLKLFAGISAGIFGVLAAMLLLLGTVEETFREHRNNLLYLFLLLSPALGFFLATLLHRTCTALWGSVYFRRDRGIVVKRRWRDGFRASLRRLRAVQLCAEPDGRSQLNLVLEKHGGGIERRFLVHHADRGYLAELGEMLAREYDLDFLVSGDDRHESRWAEEQE